MARPLTSTRAKTRYIKIEADWFESPAYRDLTLTARCLLTEFLNVYRPSRNGKLSISTRNAAVRLSVTENTCIKAFRDLVEHGFLILTNHENWIQGKAREFELTVRPVNGRVQKDSWKEWEFGKPVSVLPQRKKRRPQNLRLSA